MKISLPVSLLRLFASALTASTCFSISLNQIQQVEGEMSQQLVQAKSFESLLTQATPLRSCTRVVSVPITEQLNLRKCREKKADHSNDLFILEKDGKEIGEWTANPSFNFELLQAFRADLDGDGSKELIVADHNTSSNGVGIRYWSIYILPDPSIQSFQLPLQFQTEEYGRQGTFVFDGNQFEVWSTEWDDGIIGQQWRYRQGQLLPTAHPVLKRWYSFNFEAERLKTFDDPHIPYLWLATPKVQAHEEHPLLETAEFVSAEDGTVQSVDRECVKSYVGCVERIRVTFKSSQGVSVSYLYNADGHRYLPEGEDRTLAYFADWKSRRTFPKNYLPSDPEKWLKGNQVKLVTYKYGKARTNPSTLKILWII